MMEGFKFPVPDLSCMPSWDDEDAPTWAKSFAWKMETGEWCWMAGVGGSEPNGGFIHYVLRE